MQNLSRAKCFLFSLGLLSTQAFSQGERTHYMTLKQVAPYSLEITTSQGGFGFQAQVLMGGKVAQNFPRCEGGPIHEIPEPGYFQFRCFEGKSYLFVMGSGGYERDTVFTADYKNEKGEMVYFSSQEK